jgi:tetratricopeptide (TPR) repeat protein
MPNGGKDCCGTCIFKEYLNKEKIFTKYNEIYCKIRKQIITNPFYTYCANWHTHCQIPQGPIYTYGLYSEGDKRVPWHNNKVPTTGISGKCFGCGIKFDPGYEIDDETDIKCFCSCSHYMKWWKDIHPNEKLLWDCSQINDETEKKCIIFYNDALKYDKNNSHAWFNKGYLLASLERYEETINCFDKVIELEPNNSMAYNNKAHSLEKLGNFNDAIQLYKKALEIDANNNLALKNLQNLEKK